MSPETMPCYVLPFIFLFLIYAWASSFSSCGGLCRLHSLSLLFAPQDSLSRLCLLFLRCFLLPPPSSCHLPRPPSICPFLFSLPLPLPSMLSPSSFSLLDSPPFPYPSLHFSVRKDSLIVFLARRIPQAQIDRHSIHRDLARIVVKHGRDVFAGKGVGGVRDQEACLVASQLYCNSATVLEPSP